MSRIVFILFLLFSVTACNALTQTKPSVVIVSPPSGSVFREGELVVVQTAASDSSGVARIELMVDGVAVNASAQSGQTSASANLQWQATSGSHTITIRAVSKSGGVSDPAAVSIMVAPGLASAATPTLAQLVTRTAAPTVTTAPIPVSPSLIPTLRAVTVTPPTSAPTIAPAPTNTNPGLAIQSFTAEVKDIAGIKQVSFAWKSTGGINARITSGTSQRFPQAWNVQPNGSLIVEMKSTTYPNPAMTLNVYDANNNQVSKTVNVVWPCPFAYFFSPTPGTCAQSAPATTSAAEQTFQNGRMIWLREMRLGETAIQNIILVLYADGKYERYADTWVDSMPASDPSIIAPAGLNQPVRGFGKVWRENTGVRPKIGWAIGNEKAFDSIWQSQMRESPPSVGNVKTIDGKVIELTGEQAGSWKVVQ